MLKGGADQYVTYKVKPNFRTPGQKGMGKQAQDLKKSMATISAADAQALVMKLNADGKATVHGVDLDLADVGGRLRLEGGLAAAGGRIGVVVPRHQAHRRAARSGYPRELLNRIQTARKEMGPEFVDRIAVTIEGPSARSVS